MKALRNLISLDKSRRRDYTILLTAPILLTVYYYRGYANKFLDTFPSFESHPLLDLYRVMFQFASFFLLLLILPWLINQFYLKRTAVETGFGIGDWRFGLKFTAILFPVAVFMCYLASQIPEVRLEYPMSKILLVRHDLIPLYDLCYLLLYYIAWEYFFRGYMLFGLRESFGDFTAVLLQMIPSCLIHLGKPESETLTSIAAGIIFGLVALRTRSIWYGLFIHAAIGIMTDLFIIYG